MGRAELPSQGSVIESVSKGESGKEELDRGGNWSPEHRIWVDRKYPEFFRSLTPKERMMVEALGEVSLTIGRIFKQQLDDADNHAMWPKEVSEEGGAQKVLDTYGANPSVADPYSVLSDGLRAPATPYSTRYAPELRRLNASLSKVAEIEDESSRALTPYIDSLQLAYSPELEGSDIEKMRKADTEWVGIPPTAKFLIFAEPTETYHDPVRGIIGREPKISEWAQQVSARTGLEPWRNFFEFRLMAKDESMVSHEEVQHVRHASKQLFGTQDQLDVPVSLEFRRLILASGQGSHPAKTAKNYPNFEDIRDNVGYKNVLYTNMIEEGARTQLIPELYEIFGTHITDGFSEEELIRGSALRVVAHEENHPFARFQSDKPLEELKATVNGIVALGNSGKFSETDIRAALLTNIGGSLFLRNKHMEKAKKEGNVNALRGFESYSRGDTILFNYIEANGGFIFDQNGRPINLNYQRIFNAITRMSEDLTQVRESNSGADIQSFYQRHENEEIWESFRRK